MPVFATVDDALALPAATAGV